MVNVLRNIWGKNYCRSLDFQKEFSFQMSYMGEQLVIFLIDISILVDKM